MICPEVNMYTLHAVGVYSLAHNNYRVVEYHISESTDTISNVTCSTQSKRYICFKRVKDKITLRSKVSILCVVGGDSK